MRHISNDWGCFQAQYLQYSFCLNIPDFYPTLFILPLLYNISIIKIYGTVNTTHRKENPAH
jgi:hypothetical protein